jgi:nicotinic acid phosphoribosyltransferase
MDRSIAHGILFTDEYQLVMAQLYFELGLHEKEVQFDHYFRNYPDYGAHKAGYCINAGLECEITNVVPLVKTGTFAIAETLHFTDSDRDLDPL